MLVYHNRTTEGDDLTDALQNHNLPFSTWAFLMRFIDLFSGIGGFHHALHDLGHECVFASDIDKNCNDVYSKNWPITPNGDLSKRYDLIPEHDVLCAGFPCQPFSKSGSRLGLNRKVNGTRNSFAPRTTGTHFGVIRKILKEHNTPYVLLENVLNLKTHDGGRTLDVIRGSLLELNYKVSVTDLSPHQFGIPHHRPRIFIVAIKREVLGDNLEFQFPKPQDTPTNVRDIRDVEHRESDISPALHEVLDHWSDLMRSLPEGVKPPSPTWSMEFGRSYDLDEIHPVSEQSKARLCRELEKEGLFNANPRWDKKRILRLFPPYIRKMKGRMPKWKRQFIRRNRKFWEDYEKSAPDGWLDITRNFSDTHQKFEWHVGSQGSKDVLDWMVHIRPSGIRVSRLDKIPALVAMAQIPIIGPWGRRITPREAARAQSFGDDFELHDNPGVAFKQLGNSVNVEIVRMVMEEIDRIAEASGFGVEHSNIQNPVEDFQFNNQ